MTAMQCGSAGTDVSEEHKIRAGFTTDCSQMKCTDHSSGAILLEHDRTLTESNSTSVLQFKPIEKIVPREFLLTVLALLPQVSQIPLLNVPCSCHVQC